MQGVRRRKCELHWLPFSDNSWVPNMCHCHIEERDQRLPLGEVWPRVSPELNSPLLFLCRPSVRSLWCVACLYSMWLLYESKSTPVWMLSGQSIHSYGGLCPVFGWMSQKITLGRKGGDTLQTSLAEFYKTLDLTDSKNKHSLIKQHPYYASNIYGRHVLCEVAFNVFAIFSTCYHNIQIHMHSHGSHFNSKAMH